MQEDFAAPLLSAGFASVELEKLRDETRSEKTSDDFFLLLTEVARQCRSASADRRGGCLALPRDVSASTKHFTRSLTR
jgi:hypothetical protein